LNWQPHCVLPGGDGDLTPVEAGPITDSDNKKTLLVHFGTNNEAIKNNATRQYSRRDFITKPL
jgi:hypothetical protein